MEIAKVFDKDSIDKVADNLFSAVSNSVSEVKAMQQRKAAENVQIVIQALKKIESDLQDKFDGVTTVIEKRVATIKDGRDGLDGRNGRDGKDGRPGRDGAPGARGPAGVPGTNGRDGEDGVSVTDARIDFDGSLIISLSSGREINVGEVVAPDLAEKIKVITNGGGTSQSVLDSLASLQAQITALQNLGAVNYVGTWNASTNSPTITSGSGDKGDYYVVSVAGSTNIDGQTLWGVGDWIIFNGAVWQKVDGGSTGDFTNLSASGAVTLSGGTADGVAYLNGSKVLTTGSALVFNGTNLGLGVSPTAYTINSRVFQIDGGANAAEIKLTNNTSGASGTTGAVFQMAGNDLYIWNTENSFLSFGTNAAERMRLDSSGNLGLGVTPSAWASGWPAFQVGTGAALWSTSDGRTSLGSNTFVGSGPTAKYIGNGFASSYAQLNGVHSWYIAPNNTSGAGATLTATQAMTLDANGNLGLGTTSPNGYGSSYTVATINNATTGAVLDLDVADVRTATFFTTTAETRLGSITNIPLTFYTNNTERARIDSSGNLIVGGTSAVYTNANRGNISINGTSTALLGLSTGGTGRAYLYTDGSRLDLLNTQNDALTFGTNNTERARIDSSGNLGLGVTPSAWASGKRFLDVNASASYGAFGSSDAMMLANAYWNGSNWIRKNANNAFRFVMESISSSPTMNWQVAANGAAGSTITFTQAMTLDASGNLALTKIAFNSDSPFYTGANISSGSTALGIGSTGAAQVGFFTNNTERARITSGGDLLVGTTSASFASGGGINVKNASTSNVRIISGSSTGFDLSQDTGGNTYIYNRDNGFMAFATNNTERARIDSSGNLIVGATSPIAVYNKVITVVGSGSAGLTMGDGTRQYAFGVNGGALQFYDNTASAERARITSGGDLLVGTTAYPGAANVPGVGLNPVGQIAVERNGGIAGVFNRYTSDGNIIIFRRSGTQVGSIDVTTTATSYVTSSDYRLKENIQPMTGALAKVAALKPCTYRWKVDGSAGEGFIAHELAEVCPSAVSGEKDAVNEDGSIKSQGIDTSFLVATLTAAIQELKAEFDAYKATHP